MSGFLRMTVVLVVAAVAAVVANFVLLGVATGGDPVGRLSPRGGPAPAALTVGRATPPAPRSDHEHHSDD
jgi:hypothetical protein